MDKVDKLTGSLDEGRITFEHRPVLPARDPVCGREVRPEAFFGSTAHEGTRIYFCSEECKRRFEAQPEAYAPAAARSGPPVSPLGGVRTRRERAVQARLMNRVWMGSGPGETCESRV